MLKDENINRLACMHVEIMVERNESSKIGEKIRNFKTGLILESDEPTTLELNLKEDANHL